MIFDVLRVDDGDAYCLPYAERRALLAALDLSGLSVADSGGRTGAGVRQAARARWRSASRRGVRRPLASAFV
jgi:ATP-dependent DNA ligase